MHLLQNLMHILVSNINKHLNLGSILADCQRSCETQLVQFVHDIICGKRKSAKYLGITISDDMDWVNTFPKFLPKHPRHLAGTWLLHLRVQRKCIQNFGSA